MTKLILALATFALLGLSVGQSTAWARWRDGGLRSHHQCREAARHNHRLRDACNACVERPHHHFHPNFSPGERCVRDGKG
jgi:hypothetical protein